MIKNLSFYKQKALTNGVGAMPTSPLFYINERDTKCVPLLLSVLNKVLDQTMQRIPDVEEPF